MFTSFVVELLNLSWWPN